MLSNYYRSVLYVGMTNDIEVRILQHKAGIGSSFTKKYRVIYLMYFETLPDIQSAISREKQLKNWHRDWKWNLIKEENPELVDIADAWFDQKDIESVWTGRFS